MKAILLLGLAGLASCLSVWLDTSDPYCFEVTAQTMDLIQVDYTVTGNKEDNIELISYGPDSSTLSSMQGKRHGLLKVNVAESGDQKICFRRTDRERKKLQFSFDLGESLDNYKKAHDGDLTELEYELNKLKMKIEKID